MEKHDQANDVEPVRTEREEALGRFFTAPLAEADVQREINRLHPQH